MVVVIPILLLTVISAFTCYGIGFAVLYKFKIRCKNLFDIFYASVIGLSILTSLYATIATKGQTILVLLPLLVLGPIWFRSQAPNIMPVAAIKQKPAHWVNILALPFGAAFFTLIRYAFNRAPDAGQVMTASQDYVFYSKSSYAFNMKGIEYPFINALADGPLNPQAYHYLDLWSNALLVRLTKLPSMVLLNSVVYGLMLGIVFIGFGAVYERYITRRFILFALALVSVFTCGIYFSIFHHVPLLQASALMNTFTMPVIRPKIVPVIIFVLLGYCFMFEGRVVAAAWIWSALALVYTVVAPAAYITGGSVVLYLLIRKRISFTQAMQALAAYALAAVFIGAFYWIPSHLHPAEHSYTLSYLQYLPNLHDLRTVMNSFVGTLLIQGVYYGPYLIVIGFLLQNGRQLFGKWMEYEAMLVSTLIFLVVSTTVGAIFFRATDGYQLGINLLLPVIIINIAILIGVTLQYHSTKTQLFTIVALGILSGYGLQVVNLPNEFSAGTRHDKAFVQQVSAMSPHLSRYGALMLDSNEYTTTHALNSDISTVGMYVGLVRDNTLLLSLSVAAFDHSLQAFQPDTAFASYLVSNAPFTQFVRKQRMGRAFISLEEAQRDFLIQNGINFICASPRVRLSPLLQHLVMRTLTDPVSKQSMYVLNVPLKQESQPAEEQLVGYIW